MENLTSEKTNQASAVKGAVTKFIKHNYKHFNSLALKNASEAFKKHVEKGGKMFLSMAGAMSTGEIGISLAEMIRKDKIHAISCTGANLEEDVFNLISNREYVLLPNYRDLTPDDDKKLLDKRLNRVTDTCIPESVMIKVQNVILKRWRESESKGERKFPHEFFTESLLDGDFKKDYQIDPVDSWLLAAAEKKLPIFVPGWEDSTLGNMFAAQCIKKQLNPSTIKTGIEYMIELADWYQKTSKTTSAGIGFFQIGGGIAGDFSICVVPMIACDLKKEIKTWNYFCQISDSITSYGSYSGAVPSEKITWGKLSVDSPKFIIESDASIVVPLIFNYVLEN